MAHNESIKIHNFITKQATLTTYGSKFAEKGAENWHAIIQIILTYKSKTAAFKYVNMSNIRTEWARSVMCGSNLQENKRKIAPGGQQQRNDSEHAKCGGVPDRYTTPSVKFSNIC